MMSKYQLGETENHLLQQIYAAALAPEKWHEVMMVIANYVHADVAHLFFCDSELVADNFLPSRNDKNLFDTLKEKIYNGKAIVDINHATTIQSSSGSISDSLPVWVDNFSSGNGGFAIFVPLIYHSHLISVLKLYCHANIGQPAPETCIFLQLLAPHMAQSLYIYRQSSALKKSNQFVLETLTSCNLAVLLLNANLQVLFMAPEAQQIIAASPSLLINKNGYLLVGDAIQQAHLEKRLRQALVPIGTRHCDEGSSFHLPLKIAGKLHPLKINIVPLGDSVALSNGQVRLALFMNDPERLCKAPRGYLQQAYEFTRTEVQIANLLVNGCDVAEVARRRRTTLETARWQMKSLMHKTNTASQSELIRLLMLLSKEFSDSTTISKITAGTINPHWSVNNPDQSNALTESNLV